jgi:hypothetical protein
LGRASSVFRVDQQKFINCTFTLFAPNEMVLLCAAFHAQPESHSPSLPRFVSLTP